MATEANLKFRLGETWPIDLTCHDSAGAVLNISSATAIVFAVSRQREVVLSASLLAGITKVGGGTGGECSIRITPAAQAAAPRLAPGSLDYEIRVTLADGTVTDQAFGVLELLPSALDAA